MMRGVWLLVPVLLPVVAGVLCIALPAFGNRHALRVFLTAVLGLELLAVLGVILGPESELALFQLSENLPVLLRADLPAKCFCALAAAMFFLAGVFSFEYMRNDENERRFYLFYLLVLGMLCGLGLSGNLLTLYLFFEGMSLLSMPLVMHPMTRQSIAAAFQYLFYSIGGAALALVGLYFVNGCGGLSSFAAGGALDPAALAGNEAGMLAASLSAIVGFCTKAGMFPLHAWLPAAHPVAPAPASAVLSGVITKSGVFAALRFVFYTVGADFLRGSYVQYAWMVLALLSILLGSTRALREPLLKKRLAYSSISQVSYILFGLSTLTATGMLGALLHVLFHSVAKNGLFLCAGAILIRTGKTQVHELRGLGREMPIVLGCFAVFALSAVGIPPTGGFVGKWYIASGALGAEIGAFSWLGPVVLLLSALLTAGYLLPIAVNGFYPGDAGEARAAAERRDPNRLMRNPLLALAALALLLGLFAGGFVSLFESITATLF